MKRQVKKPRPASRRRPFRAATRDVLGAQSKQKVPQKWAHYYRRLIDLRDHLLRERGELSAAARDQSSNFSLHMADAGTDAYDRDWALGMLSSEQDALYAIDRRWIGFAMGLTACAS